MIAVKNIQLYSNIKELTIERFKAIQLHLVQDSGIGNTIGDIDTRFQRLSQYIIADRKPDAAEEIKNLRYTFFSMLMGIDYKSRAFACLIKSIDGKERSNLTNDGLDETVSLIDISYEEMEGNFEEIKKNLIPNLN